MATVSSTYQVGNSHQLCRCTTTTGTRRKSTNQNYEKTHLEDDVFPHTVSDKPLLALEAIYSEDATSRMAAAMFRDAADRNAKDVDNDAYLSEALDDFEAILDTPDFLEEIRHQLYMYLEPSMEDLVMDSFQDLNHLDRLVMGSH